MKCRRGRAPQSAPPGCAPVCKYKHLNNQPLTLALPQILVQKPVTGQTCCMVPHRFNFLMLFVYRSNISYQDEITVNRRHTSVRTDRQVCLSFERIITTNPETQHPSVHRIIILVLHFGLFSSPILFIIIVEEMSCFGSCYK